MRDWPHKMAETRKVSRGGKKGGRKFGDLAELFKAGNFPRKVANLQIRDL